MIELKCTIVISLYPVNIKCRHQNCVWNVKVKPLVANIVSTKQAFETD